MKHKDNRGFSLVEMLVAIIILAIVIIPFLHSFVSSYTVNVKSRQTLRATTLAQNEMEIFEREKIEDLKDSSQFSYDVTENIADGSIEFVREGVINDDSGREMFDVYVKLDPLRDEGERYNAVNTEKVTSVNSFSTQDSARYVMPVRTENNRMSFDEQKYDEFVVLSENAGKNKDRAYFEENVKRTITLSVEKTGEDTVAKVKYRYVAPKDSVVEKKNVIENEEVVFTNSQSKDKDGKPVELKSLYLFYSPRYKTAKNDTIAINNAAGLPIDIYIIRQDVLRDGSDTVVEPVPSTYQAVLDIKDTSETSRYHTNLKIDNTVADVTDGAEFILKYNSDTQATGDARKTAIEKLHFSNLVIEEEKDRIYDMRVEVYSAGGKDRSEGPLASLTGTKLE